MIVRPPDLGAHNPYAEIDPILGPWADERGIRVFAAYKDDEVRSFELRGRSGKYQVWIPWPATDIVTVHIWRRDNRGTVTFGGGVAELRKNLDLAFDLAMNGRPTGESTRIPPPPWVWRLLKWLRLDKP